MTIPTMTTARKELLKGGVSLLLLLLMMLWLAGTFVRKVEPGEEAIPSARFPGAATATVEEVAYPLEAEQLGTIKTKADTWVSSRIMAQVRELLVSEGTLVQGPETKSPTMLARLDDRDVRARVRQAESNLLSARKAVETARAQREAARAHLTRVTADYRRYHELYTHQAATGQQLDQMRAQLLTAEAQLQAANAEVSRMEAQVVQAEAALAEAKTTLDYTVIYAPFSGKVLKKAVETGAMVSPGQPLFYIETRGQPELHTWVAESLLPYLSRGQSVDVSVDAINKRLSGTVREIVPQSETSSRTVLVKVSLPPDDALVNGLFGRFSLTYGTYRTLVVPTRAVRKVGQLRLLSVVNPDGSTSRRFVTVGKTHGEMVEILSGVTVGEEVLVP